MAGILSDELSKRMDADLFGEEKKTSLDPKISEQMDKDLGLASSRPWSSLIKPPEPEEPGYLGALGKGVYTGFRRRLPEQVGQAIQFTGIAPETGKAIAQLGTEGEVRPQFKNPIKQVLYEGGEMLAPSVAIPAALGAAGVGVLPASIATAGLFGLSQAQQTKETAEKAGVEPGAAPYATGAIEALGEAAGTYYLTRLLGPLAPLFKAGTRTTAREVVKPTLGRLIKEFPKTLAVEAGTEFGQQAGEAAVEKYSGIRPEAEPLREGLGVIGPTAVLTGLTMGVGHPLSRMRGNQLEKILTDPKIAPETREAAVNAVSSYMEEADKGIGERWREKALETVRSGQAIPMEEDIYEWLGLKPKQAIPAKETTKGVAAESSESTEPEKPGAAPEAPAPKPPETQETGPIDLLNRQEPASQEDWQELQTALRTAIPTEGREKPASGTDWAELPQAAIKPEEYGAAVQDLTKPAAERRNDLERRKRIAEMNPEEMRRELLTDPLTGLKNRRAYDEEEKLPYQAMIDVDSLKAVNDIMGHDKGDELLKAVGQALGEHATRAYHTSGDEFIAQGSTEEEIHAQLKKAQDKLKNAEISYTAPDGTVFKYKGLEFSYGISKSLGEADQRLAAIKTEREKQGLRARRGERPPGMVEIPAARGNVQGQPAEVKDWQGLQETLSAISPPEQTRREAPIAAVTPEQYGAAISTNVEKAKEIETAAHEAATSPVSAITEPTEAQKKAGNYRKGHIKLHGLDISIENPQGSVRSGVSKEGKPWQTVMAHHYGYILGTKGKDKDHIDTFIGSNPASDQVFVVDQVDPQTGKFDEHKVLLGFNSQEEARESYLANYEKGWKGLGGMVHLSMKLFKGWLEKGETTRPITPGLRETPPEKIQAIETQDEIEATRKVAPVKPETEPAKSEAAPVKPEAEQPEEAVQTYEGIPVSKRVKDLTYEEFEKVVDFANKAYKPMPERNRELAYYENDPRFLVHLNKGENGYQPSLPPHLQPVRTDYHLIRDYLKEGVLTEHAHKMQKIAGQLKALDKNFADDQGTIKTAYKILSAIERGVYGSILHPQNRTSRKVFEILTGKKLPPGVRNTSNLFQGEPFKADFSKLTAPEFNPGPVSFTRRLSEAQMKDLKLSEFRKASDDYYIQDHQMTVEKVPDARPLQVPGLEKFDLFIRKDDKGFTISEAITGVMLSTAGSEAEAIEQAQGVLKQRGLPQLEETVLKTAIRRGITPRYKVVKEAAKKESGEETAPGKPAQAETKPKEAWELTREEWNAKTRFYRSGKTKNAGLPNGKRVILNQESTATDFLQTSGKFLDDVRGQYIEAALKQGKPVPAEVLKDYPDLTQKPTEKSEAKAKELNLLPSDWLQLGWKIESRGALQVAISPEGKEYSFWGMRLEPIKETRKEERAPEPTKETKPSAETLRPGFTVGQQVQWRTRQGWQRTGKVVELPAPGKDLIKVRRDGDDGIELIKPEKISPLEIPGEIRYPDLTVTGQAKDVPDHPGVQYVVHKAKVNQIDDRPFRVIMTRTGESGFLSVDGKGYTPEGAYESALASFDDAVKRQEANQPEKPKAAEEVPTVIPGMREVAISPDLEYQRFIEGLSDEQRNKAGGLIVPNPRNPEAQMRAIKKDLGLEGEKGEPAREKAKAEVEKREPAPGEVEEEVTPRSIPYPAVTYANGLKNKLKKNYAWAYLKWKTGKTEGEPEPRGLSTLGAQIVRMSIDKLLGEPYKFKPKVEEAKSEGGKVHETRRSEEVGEGQLVERPPGVDAGERATAREEPLRERPGEAGRTPEPGGEEGVQRLDELEEGGPGSPGLRRRNRRQPAAPGEPARVPAGGTGREDQGLGRGVRHGRPDRIEDRNHVISPDATLVPGGKISRIKANIAAIELAKSLEKEKRNPTPEEKKILAQFTGWGALGKEAFEPEQWIHHDADKNGTLKSQYSWNYYTEEEKKEYKSWFDRIGKKLHPDLGGLLTKEEWDEAKSSILNAFYTSREVIENGLWPIISRLGFKGGTILEPAGGVGHILGLMPENIAENSRIQAVEKDRMSGLILSKLYPEAKVFVKSFEQSREIRDNSVDLVVSNFPFGDIRIFDPRHKDYSGFSIHNYFFARSIDALKPGGILVAITSHFTLDSAGTEHRKYLASKADFVGGLRLPGTAFEKTAGTEVTTDILVFRKKDASNFKGESFIDTRPVDVSEKDDKGNPQAAYVNEYFAMNPSMVLGKHSLQGTMYAKDTYTLLPFAGKELKNLLPEQIETLPEDIAGESSIEMEPAPIFADEGTKDGLIIEKEGKIYINEGGRLNPIFGIQKAEPVRKYIGIRTALKDLITMELGEAEDAAIEGQRRKLNRIYDGFVAKHGFISAKENRWLREDAEFSLMSSLESEDKEKSKASGDKIYKKAAILTQRTNFPFKEPETAASEEDAVKISLTYRNKIDLPYVAKLLGADKEEVRESLVKKKVAYLNPATGNLESPDEYLSGNVREKLQKAEEAAKDDPAFDINVEELKKIQPADLGINQIYYRLGSPWIPTEAIEDFMGDLLNFKDVEVRYVETAESSKFTVAVDSSASWRLRDNAAVNNVWGVEGANALSLIEDSLNLRFTAIYDSEWDPEAKKEKPVFNPQKSQAAREMQRKINDEFIKWTRKHDKWAGELAGIYNRDFNNTVLKEFPVPDMEYYPNASHGVRLRKHQRRAVSRNLQESCIDAHAVGTGKTYIFATTAMEMRRLGTARKPMIVVQNSTVHQYAKAFRELYPTANILIPNKKQLSKENRKRLISQIVTGNWDAIIVPHSAFDMISVTPEKEAAYIREQVGDLERIISEMQAEDEDKRTIRQIEKLKEAKEQKLHKLLAGKREDIIYFDEIGVDALLVDEAHRYKRGEFYTKMTKIKGIDRQSASRSMLMLLKAQEVSKRTGGKNVVLATGTPISNTLAEIWTMLRYVRPDLLERFNARQFDSFAANFGQVVQETEETPTGDFKVIERFAKYVNGPEILAMWRSASDIVLPEDVEVQRPKIKTGKPIDLQLSRPEELASFIKWIKAEREAWDRLSGKEKMQSSHVPLVLFGLAKKAAIDLRLVDPKMPDLPGSKVNRCVEEVFKRWKESEKFRAAQVIFSDTFQSTDKSFNLFKDIKKKLIEKGVPASDIAVIHDFNSDDKRDDLFGRVNDGDIRVIMGTTEKLGVGVNIQDKLLAAHHIDVPQRPMDFEQRNGRIWRPGNLNDEIDILVYGVKNTLDSTGFQRLLIKQKFINQIMRGDIRDRSFDDPFDPTQATFQDMMSAFGNPKVREKFGLENQIRDLNSLKESHENEIARARREIDHNKYRLKGLRESLKNWDEISNLLKEAFPDNKVTEFAFEVKGKMTKMDKDHFLQAVQDRIDEITNRAKEMIGKGEFDIDRDFHKAEKEVQALSSVFANFHGELNGIPVRLNFIPSTMSGREGKTHHLSFEGVGIEYALRPREYKDFNYYLERKVSTPGGILISMQSLVPYGIGHPREIREDIAKTENNIKNLAPLLDQPFDREAEIREKKTRLAEVEKELMAAESETEEEAKKNKEKKESELDSLRHEYGGIRDKLYAEKKEVEETPAEEKQTPEISESEKEKVEGEKGTPSFKLESPRVPAFYSALQRAIEQKMGGSMPVAQLRVLLKQPGIKQEEIKWSGIDDFLAGREGKIARQEILDFLKQNRIQVREVLKGEKTRELSWEKKRDGSYSADDESGAVWEAIPNGNKSGWELFRDGNPYGVFETAARAMMRAEEDADFGPTKFGRFTVPGGKNYRELLFTLPSRGFVKGTDGDVHRFHDISQALWTNLSAAQRNELRSEYRKITGGKERAGFRSSHWSEPNVLAHARFNERTDAEGKRVLFIEEIQSDWHQEGRKKGYQAKDLPPRYRVVSDEKNSMWAVLPEGSEDFIYASAISREDAIEKALNLINRRSVPPAPFAKTWHEFVLKRMIRWAAENGFDRIAWTTGDQQADRYDLAKAVNRIEWEKTGPDEENGTVALSIKPKNVEPEELYREIGQRTGIPWDNDPDTGPLLYVPADRLDEIIGKDLAKRILEDRSDTGSFEGENLKIGGEGMKGFYDKIIPDFLNRFGKKWGAKVEESEIETGIMAGDAENDLPLIETEDPLQLLPDTVMRSVHSLPITESMKKSALTEGFPMFMPERSSWSDKTARVIPHSTIEKLKSHPDYGAAKAGDRGAGLRLARDLMKSEKIAELKKALAKEKQVIIIAPVRMRERGLDNAIPPLMAEVISGQTGWRVDTSIIQINDVAHTEKDAIDRLFAQAEFDGDVVPGATYVILDDVVTTGGTLANLKGFIESKGGKVKAIQTIGAAQFATNLKIMPGTLKNLQETYGQSLKEVLDFVYGGPIHEKNLTESEARTFIRNKGEILERRRKARDESQGRQGFSLGQRRAPQRTLPAKELTSPEDGEGMDTGREPAEKIPPEELTRISALVQKIAHSKVVFQDTISIDLRDPKVQAGLKKHGYTDEEISLYISEGYTAHQVAGRMTPVLVSPTQWKAMINVAIRGKDAWQVKSTALHEAFEAVRDFMLTPQEKEILDRRIPGQEGRSATENQAEAFADFSMGKKGLVLPKSVQSLFDKIQSFFERLGNYLRGLGYKSAEDIFEKAAAGEIRERYEAEERDGERMRGEKIPAFKFEGPIWKIINTLKSPDFLARAEQDKGFKDSIRKTRLGLVKVTDNDLKLWERALSLPFWLQVKYKELRPLVQTQMKREESRSETIHGLLSRAQPFFALKSEEMDKVEKALVQGDREGKVYEEKELREKFSLAPEGIEGYRAVRETLDWIHAEWKGKIEQNILREYEKEKWFTLFKAAHGLEFSDEETLGLDKALKKTHKVMEKPVETVRAHLQRVFEDEFSHQNKKLLADLLGDYMRAYRRARKQIDKIKDIVRDAIGEGMSEEDLNKNTQALVQAYIRSLPAMHQLKELRSELNRIKGYFPRSRKMGKYRVVVLDEVEYPTGEKEKYTVFYQNAANRLEATKIYDKIKADPEYKDMDIAIEPNRQEAETTFMGASAVNMQRLVDNAIDKLRTQADLPAEIANLIRMNVLETLADELKARGAGRFSIRRAENIIEGYQKTNLKEVLKAYIDGWSGMITKQEAALEFLDELKAIPRSKPQLMAYGSKYAQDMLRNQEPMDRISAKMRSMAFLYFLGGSLRAAAVNFTQNYVTGIPFLAREVGAKSLKAEKLYHKAMFDVAVGKNLNDVEKRMLDEMINKGVAEDQFIRQINREVKGAVGQWTGKVVDILSKPFSWMEKLNRKSAALAMFREKYNSYSSNKAYTSDEAYRKAFEEAQDFVYKTHYLMTKANLPSMAAGGDVGAQFVKTAYTFRRFTHNYLLSLHHSFKGEDGRLALDVMARSLAYVVLLAGIPAIPFLDDLLDEWEKFFGTPVRSNMRKTLRDAGGPVLEKMGLAGIPALMGIDISGSLKIGVPLAGSGTPQDTIYGVYGGLARKSLNAMSAVEREDYLRATEFASPAFIEAILKAYRMSETGVTTPRGKVITDEQGKPIRLEGGEGFAQAVGFRPERLARISGEHWTMENVQAHFKEKRDDLYSRYRMARTQEEKGRVIRDMQKFNIEARKYRGVIPPITTTSIGKATQQKLEKQFVGFGRTIEANQ